MQVANDLSLQQIKATRLASEGVIKHVADVRLLIPRNVPESIMYDLLIQQARDYLNAPQLDRGVVKFNNSNFTTVFDPEGTIEIQHAHGHKTVKSPIMTVIHEYIKKTPGTIYGFHEEHVIEVILRLSVVRTDIISIQPKIDDHEVTSCSTAVISDHAMLKVATDDIQPPPPQTVPTRTRR